MFDVELKLLPGGIESEIKPPAGSDCKMPPGLCFDEEVKRILGNVGKTINVETKEAGEKQQVQLNKWVLECSFKNGTLL